LTEDGDDEEMSEEELNTIVRVEASGCPANRVHTDRSSMEVCHQGGSRARGVESRPWLYTQEYPEKTIGLYSEYCGYFDTKELFVFEAASDEGFTRRELLEAGE
jgi:hypothetical protein